MLIVDSHVDIAHNALEWDRDLLQSIAGIRESEAGMGQKGRGLNMVNYEEQRRGDIGLFFVTVACRIASMGKRFSGVRNQDIAYAKCRGELAYYRLMESKGVLRQIRDRQGLEAHLKDWGRDSGSTPLGFVLTMEGADGIVSPEQVPEWWDEGLRVVSLCHYGVSSYSHGTQAPGGLTPRGRPLLNALEAAGMLLDLTHLADQAFWEALDAFGGRVLATHNCCRALCDHDRQFEDSQIRAIVERSGGHRGGPGRLDALTPVGPPGHRQQRHHAGNGGRPHGPHLPGGGQLQPRRDRDRSGWGLRERAGSLRHGHHRRPAAHPRDPPKAGLRRCGHRQGHARQLDRVSQSQLELNSRTPSRFGGRRKLLRSRSD